MMSPADSFFIETPVAYLFGWNAEEPLSREKLKRHQPYYVTYLPDLSAFKRASFVIGSLLENETFWSSCSA